MGLRILVKARNLLGSKKKQFLPSKTFNTKFPAASRNFNRMNAFARWNWEILCELGICWSCCKTEELVKCFLVLQDLSVEIVDAKRMKEKDSKETFPALIATTTKKKSLKKTFLDKHKIVAEDFEKLCKVEGMYMFSIKSQIEPAIAGRTKRCLKRKVNFKNSSKTAYTSSFAKWLS